MAYATDSRVDGYIEALPQWQQAICREVRDLVHAADPGVAETIKFRNRPYFVLEGNVCALLAAKDHVNVFLYDGAIVPDPEHIITGGHDNTDLFLISGRCDNSVVRECCLMTGCEIVGSVTWSHRRRRADVAETRMLTPAAKPYWSPRMPNSPSRRAPPAARAPGQLRGTTPALRYPRLTRFARRHGPDNSRVTRPRTVL